jgi:hypothetical protein
MLLINDLQNLFPGHSSISRMYDDSCGIEGSNPVHASAFSHIASVAFQITAADLQLLSAAGRIDRCGRPDRSDADCAKQLRRSGKTLIETDLHIHWPCMARFDQELRPINSSPSSLRNIGIFNVCTFCVYIGLDTIWRHLDALEYDLHMYRKVGISSMSLTSSIFVAP